MSSGKARRLAVTVDPELPVPPKRYGGIERIVDMLVNDLVKRGYDVTLFAHPDSHVPCKLESYPGRKSQSKIDLLRNMWHVSSKVLQGEFDLVHSFGRLAYLIPILPLRVHKLMSYQRPITERSVIWGDRLARGSLHFVGCSYHIIKPHAGNGRWHVVYNGVPLAVYQFREKVNANAPLVFLGRVEEFKGAHVAIEVARRSGRSLVIAGNVPDEAKHRTYFQEKISPYIDGSKIQYVGPVNDSQKNELLGKAAALLMPLMGEEAFGIVMAEALACGTPVIGFDRGPIPEVVQDGVNGFLCRSVDDMVASVKRIVEIDRKACREIMVSRFSDRVIVDEYEKLYSKICRNVLVG